MSNRKLSETAQTSLDSVSNQTFYYALAGGFAYFGHLEIACAVGVAAMYSQILGSIRKDKKIGQGGISIVTAYVLYRFVSEETAWIWFYTIMVFFILGWFVAIVQVARDE